MNGYKLGCCDCGLVHGVTFEVFKELTHPFKEGDVKPLEGYKVRLLVDRNERSTAALRREREKRKAGEKQKKQTGQKFNDITNKMKKEEEE